MANTRIDIHAYDPKATTHSGMAPQAPSSKSKFTSVEGDDHENPLTGSAMIFYPSSGNEIV
jgi:hypothetical protein